MPRKTNMDQLAKRPGRHGFGQNLSLLVRGQSALWTFVYRDRATKTHNSKQLGSYHAGMSLTEARAARNTFWQSLLAGTAPVPTRGNGKTFAEALATFIAERRAGYRGGKEIKAFERLALLPIARMSLDQIDRDTVKTALAKWHGSPTAEKMRVRISQIFAHEGRIGSDNPAAQLKGGMPALAKSVEHHPAMPAADVPGFMSMLATSDSPASRALRWTILTAARAGEVLGMTWQEIDIAKALWELPGARMKAGKAHSVPLTPSALALLGARGAADELVFGIDEKAMRALVRDRGCGVHGFRSTFSDWASEAGWDFELREIALAHAVGSQTARAYSRSAQVERRMAMMQAWSAFCLGSA